jgi:hypothetical protein
MSETTVNTPDLNLNQAIEDYHRALGHSAVPAAHYASRDARLIRTDGTILHQESIVPFWQPFMARGHNTTTTNNQVQRSRSAAMIWITRRLAA